MRFMRAPVTLVALLTPLSMSAATTSPLARIQASTPSAATLAARTQARYDTIRDFTADFTLAQKGDLLLKGAFDRGKVIIKKPGQMRWAFETGTREEVVADGVRIYRYSPQDKYVQVAEMPKDGRASSGLLLLTGRGDITRDFVPSLPAAQIESEWRVVLTPKARQNEFSTLTLAVDRASFQLRGLEMLDAQGAVQTFRFSNLRENQGIKDTAFEFKIPKGVEIR